MYINTLVIHNQRLRKWSLLGQHKPAVESNSTTKCGHPSKQEVYFSIQSGNNQLSQASETILVADPNAGHNVH